MEQFVQLGDLINPSIWAHLGMNDCGQSSQDQSREFSMTQQHKAALAQVTSYLCRPGVSGNSRSRPFPRMKASDSLSRIMGMDFFIPFPFPNFRNGFSSFSSRSRIMGMGFFHSLPVPEFWECFFFIPFPFPNYGNGFFSFPSRSRIVGMDFFHSLPVPKLTLSKSGIKRENGRF